MEADYAKMVKASSIKVEHEGVNHYINGKMNADVYDVMKDESLSTHDKTMRLLTCVICNKDGVRLFDVNNANHLNLVRSLDMGLQSSLILQAKEKFFPDKKKRSKTQS